MRFPLIFLASCLHVQAFAGELPPVNRARIIMDLVQDDEVTTLVNYADAKVDYQTAETSSKYADAFWAVYGPPINAQTGLPYPASNDNKALFLIRCLRAHFRAVLSASRVPQAGAAARAAEKSIVESEAATELGSDEALDEE